MTGFFQLITVSCSPPVLPNNSMINWFPGAAFPYHRCLSLIRNTDASHLFHRDTCFGYCFSHCTILSAPDFFSIMFYPAGLWKYLFEFFLCNTNNVALLIKNNTAAAGSALVECKNVMRRHI